MRSTRFILSFFSVITIVLLSACSEKNTTKSTESSFLAFIENKPSTLLSGKINIPSFLSDLDYKKIPKANTILHKEFIDLNKGIDLNTPIYYTVDSLLQPDGKPSSLFVFAKVKNKDSLADKLSSLGLLVIPKEHFTTAQGNNFCVGIENNLAIFQFGIAASEKNIKQAFILSKKQEKENTFHQVLKKSSALQVNLHLENMQQMMDKQLLDRNVSKEKELLSLYKNAYITSNFNFLSGNLQADIDFRFPSNLKKRLFFENSISNELKQLASATQNVAGFSFNINPVKLESFLTDYYPNLLTNATGNNFTLQLALFSLGNKPISSITDGKAGVTIQYNQNQLKPRIYLGLGSQKELITSFIQPTINELQSMNFSATSDLSPQTKESDAFFAKHFGQSGLSFFVEPNKIPVTQRSIDDKYKFLDAIQYISFELTNDGGKLIIQGKNNKKGVLNQIVMVYVESLISLFKNT